MSDSDSTEMGKRRERSPVKTRGRRERSPVKTRGRRSPVAEADRTPIDGTLSEVIFGEVKMWRKTFGFLQHFVNGEDEPVSVFAHKDNIKTNDFKVVLRKGTAVRFQKVQGQDQKWYAVNVTGTDGGPLNFHKKHGDNDGYDRTVEFGGKKFRGSIKFFSRYRGYGRIIADEAPNGDCAELYFKEIDMKASGYPIKVEPDQKVSFNIFNSSRGWGAQNVCPQGAKEFECFTPEEIEERKAERAAKKETVRSKSPRTKSPRSKSPRTKSPRTKSPRERTRRGRRARGRGRERATRGRDTKTTPGRSPAVEGNFQSIDDNARFGGTVKYFSVHKHGLIKPEDEEELKAFGVVRNHALLFLPEEVHTDGRPVLVDRGQSVEFSLITRNENQLYATNVTGIDGAKIKSDRTYEAKTSTLASKTWEKGTVKYFVFSKGHGRIVLDGQTDEEEHYYFHRDDLRSKDKVPCVSEGTRIMCQVAKDEKGLRVTNIKTEGGKLLSGFTRKGN